MDFHGVRSDVDTVQVHHGEERTQSEALSLLADLDSYPHLWSQAFDREWRNETGDWFLPTRAGGGD